MKILHTSDWHLGHSLYNYDRSEEQAAMLAQIRDIVAENQPDVFLLSGDVYHTAQPSSAVQTMFSEAIVAIHRACPSMIIVVTAGNHDSGAKHEIFRAPWRALNVYAIGSLTDDNEHIIEVTGRGFIIAVPYVNERTIPDGIFQRLLDRVAERNVANLPVIVMAHTTVLGCDFSGHDNVRDTNVGGIDCYDVATFGKGYDYIALGHIHRSQFVKDSAQRIRYSGTPLAVSFDETYSHSVSIVDIAEHGAEPQLTTIDIVNPRPLVSLPAKGAASWDDAKAALADFPADIPAYIRLNVLVEDFLPPHANAEAQALTDGKQCRFCLINAHRPDRERTATDRTFTVEAFQAEAPIDIARRYADYKGIAFDDDMTQMFNEVLQMIENDERTK
jgi:exonuclease SbcD